MGQAAINFLNDLKKQGHKEFVSKPLNSFSGIGVFKFSLTDDFMQLPQFKNMLDEILILQPFLESIYLGEIRALYWRAKKLEQYLKPKCRQFFS